MNTALAWLVAAAAWSFTSAHAASIRHDDAGAGVQLPEPLKQPLQASGLHADTAADTLSATPVGFKGFYGVDLSAAGPAAKSLAGSAFGSAHDHPEHDSRAYTPGRWAAADSAMRATAVLPAPQEGVPEPGTLAILSIGLAGLLVSSQKKA